MDRMKTTGCRQRCIFSIGALLRKIRAMFAMLEHWGLAKDFYEALPEFLDDWMGRIIRI